MTKQENKLEIKINQLTEIMMDGFDRVEEKFDRVEEKMSEGFTSLEAKSSKIESDISTLKGDMFEVKQTLRQHSKKLDEHTHLLNRVQGDLEALVDDDLKHQKHLEKIEKEQKIFKRHLKLT